MKSIEFDLMQLAPWAEIHRLLTNAKTLTVKAGKTTYAGEAELIDALDNGHLVLKVKPMVFEARGKAKVAE